jgi:magnesium-transporting ATPase (P-type)
VKRAPATQAGPDEAGWHALGPETILRRLGAGEAGLSAFEAASRLERHGENRLPEGRKVSAAGRFLRQFHNVLIYILLAAAAGTASIQLWLDTAVILVPLIGPGQARGSAKC